ncbi:SMI1/KNR4 family protein [Streptomyces monomycini]|uniref:SMI1/KNR4 family protein n=1 Tax=Streptomyces monomycini TaxID=371720 RepID=UPI0012FEEAE1|nr:SMI1/KNR4 family protein [Streptomyces monomycini]
MWKSIEAFARAWARPLTPADGIPPGEVRKAEQRLGLRLPAALYETYALFGRRQDLTAVQNPLLLPDELLLDPSGELLVFRSENQGCAGWGIPLEKLAHDDPPVSLFSDCLPDASWLPYLDRVSSACAELVLSETVMARRYGPYGRECPATAVVVAAVEAMCAPVDLPPCPAWYHPEGDPVRWYSAPGKLLCLEPDPDESVPDGSVLVVVGRSEADVREVVAAVPGDWPAAEPVPRAEEPFPGW